MRAEVTDGNLRLLKHPRMLVGKLEVKAARLPVSTQQVLQFSVLLRRDLAVKPCMDERFQLHDSPSD
jgi:hypothetical protein